MYAIIKTGGKQYKVKEGQMLKIEKLDAEAGDEVSFERVLQYSDEEGYQFGRPYIENAEVTGKVLEQGKEKKVVVLKYKPKRRYSKKTGHRQPYTKVLIENIEA
jgi:large subunit ribosomal protein L21